MLEQIQLSAPNLVEVPVGDAILNGDLVIPEDARGVVVFAHGTGSSRFSPRNRFVATELNKAKLATLLIDLLTAEEERQDAVTSLLRFEIDILGERIVSSIEWLGSSALTSSLPLGLYGASTGAGAALAAAAARPDTVRAVVSRGGRPDLAGDALAKVSSPTLLIIGSDDDDDIREMNEKALRELKCEAKLEVIDGAGHLFEEPGALPHVARLTKEWFERYCVHA